MVRGGGTPSRLLFARPGFIGSIDLRMPKKTHARAPDFGRIAGNLLELLRRPITEGRMEPHPVVVVVDESGHVL